MKRIYSKVEPEKLLHIVVRLEEIKGRTQLVPDDNFIQCSSMKMQNGKTFRPHRHIIKSRTYDKQIAQESWVVITGKVRCIFYDLDNTIIATPVLHPGDASFTLYGGHTYEILEDNTVVYEYKTGPYEGQNLDKTFLFTKEEA